MKKFTYDDYRNALKGAGPKITENILERAERDPDLEWSEFKALVDLAYPDVP